MKKITRTVMAGILATAMCVPAAAMMGCSNNGPSDITEMNATAGADQTQLVYQVEGDMFPDDATPLFIKGRALDTEKDERADYLWTVNPSDIKDGKFQIVVPNTREIVIEALAPVAEDGTVWLASIPNALIDPQGQPVESTLTLIKTDPSTDSIHHDIYAQLYSDYDLVVMMQKDITDVSGVEKARDIIAKYIPEDSDMFPPEEIQRIKASIQ